MFKARVQLALIALVLGISGYLFLGNIVNETRPPLWKSLLLFLDGTFLVSAISILACTFIRAKQMADGSVCFMPNNPLVRFEFVGKKGTDICPTFWWVGFVIAWVAMTVSLVLLVIFVLVPNMISTVSSHDFRAEDGYFLLAAVGVFAGIAALIRFIVWLSEKEFWLCKVPLIVFGVSAIVAGLYILSILAIIDYRNLSKNFDGWMAGTLIYLKWTGIGITVVASAVGIILLAFKNWGVLANSWLGRQIALLKKNLCVRFIECPGQANKA